MSTQPTLNETIVRGLATPQSFTRGREYYRAGAVLHLERRGDTLFAEVEGSQYKPYRVAVELDAGGVADYTCTCEYDWGGACKHVIAVLLAYIDQPHQVEERPAAASLLAGLDRDTLQELLQALLNRQPELLDWLEGELALRRPSATPAQPAAAPRQRATPLNTDALRRRIRQAKRAFDHDDYYRIGQSDLAQTLHELLEKARQFVEGGDGDSGLDILTVLAEETIDDWYEYDHEGDVFSTIFEELGQVLTEALLTAELSKAERKEWAARITQWQGSLGDEYGIEIDSLDAAQAAAKQGWDDPTLQRALHGEPTPHGAWKGEIPWYAETLTEARLRVLERQGRTEEYLNLARAAGQLVPYLTMLVKLSRVQEAIDHGLQHLTSADDALALAQTLRAQMRPADALRIAEHGLTLGGYKSELARWLRNMAAAQGKPELALRAARMVFAESPTLADYQAAQSLASDGWQAVKRDLLAQLQPNNHPNHCIDIYLYEQMIDAAIEIVERQPYLGYGAAEKVVDAALVIRPEWAIRQCQWQAEPIMNEGRSSAYEHALHWLEKARRAYQAAGRDQEWQNYLQGLLDKHHRKRSLVPGLRRLSLENPQ